jgi:hypothetical protein
LGKAHWDVEEPGCVCVCKSFEAFAPEAELDIDGVVEVILAEVLKVGLHGGADDVLEGFG